MKISLTYGIGLSVAGALLTLVLFFLGVHNDAEKMQASNSIVGLIGILIPVVGIVFALRATRAAAPDGGLSYGKGVLTALLVGVVAGVVGAAFNYVYTAIINPGMMDTMLAMQVAALEAKGMSQDQIAAAEGVMKTMTSPVVTSVMALFATPFIYTLVGLIAAIFVKRAPVAVPPMPPGSAALS